MITDSFRKHWWTLERFGLTPTKLAHRFGVQERPKIMCISVPKAGTHLLERALCLHPKLYRKILPTLTVNNWDKYGGLDAILKQQRPGEVLVSHIFYNPAYLEALDRHGVKIIFVVRDPRDIVVSQVFYMMRNTEHRCHQAINSLDSMNQRLKFVIEGPPNRCELPVGETLELFSGWLSSDCLVVRYEDLIGPHGNGRLETQLRVLEQIYEFVGMPVSDDWLLELSDRLVSTVSPTFRKGSTKDWQRHFTPEITETFLRETGDALQRYDYDQADLWQKDDLSDSSD